MIRSSCPHKELRNKCTTYYHLLLTTTNNRPSHSSKTGKCTCVGYCPQIETDSYIHTRTSADLIGVNGGIVEWKPFDFDATLCHILPYNIFCNSHICTEAMCGLPSEKNILLYVLCLLRRCYTSYCITLKGIRWAYNSTTFVWGSGNVYVHQR